MLALGTSRLLRAVRRWCNAVIPRRQRSRSCFQQCPEIGARALRLASGGLGGFAEAEIAVNKPGAVMISGRDASGGERIRIGLALVPQWIEPRRGDDRWREAGKIFGAQRRHAPVGAISGVFEIMAAEPFHHGARQEVAFGGFGP